MSNILNFITGGTNLGPNGEAGDLQSLDNFITGNVDTARNFEMQRRDFDFNSREAQINRDWQTQMANTAHQREAADLKAAGFNPALSLGGSGASVPSSSAASSGSHSNAGASKGGNLMDILGFALKTYATLSGQALDALKLDNMADFKNADLLMKDRALNLKKDINTANIASREKINLNNIVSREKTNFDNLTAREKNNIANILSREKINLNNLSTKEKTNLLNNLTKVYSKQLSDADPRLKNIKDLEGILLGKTDFGELPIKEKKKRLTKKQKDEQVKLEKELKDFFGDDLI